MGNRLSRHHWAQKPTCRLTKSDEVKHFSSSSASGWDSAGKIFSLLLIVTLFSDVCENFSRAIRLNSWTGGGEVRVRFESRYSRVSEVVTFFSLW